MLSEELMEIELHGNELLYYCCIHEYDNSTNVSGGAIGEGDGIIIGVGSGNSIGSGSGGIDSGDIGCDIVELVRPRLSPTTVIREFNWSLMYVSILVKV